MPKQHATIRLTRRRWDRLMLPSIVCAIVATLALICLTGHLRYLAVPLGIGALWAYLRFATPLDGMEAVTIDGNPQVKALLAWLAIVLVGGAGLLLIDTLIVGHPFHGPLHTYHWVVFAAYFALLLLGVAVIERRYRSTAPNPTRSGERSDPCEPE